MHPAFSVIFFTTMSGAGYGLWFWFALSAWWLFPATYQNVAAYGMAIVTGLVLVTTGLVSSVFHLGKPSRAWRAFSQWQTSWLSREGVSSLLAYAPLAWFGWMGIHDFFPPASFAWACCLLAVGSLATVACTAMIYASLRTIPAWSHPLVLPVYLLFSLHTGGALLLAFLAIASRVSNMAGLALVASSFLLWRMKRRYWRDIDRGAMPVTRTSALGLPADRTVRVFERPHTEANYLTREMGFVPALSALPVWLLPHVDAAPLLLVAAASALLGAFVERWLFFAEARHVVMQYY